MDDIKLLAMAPSGETLVVRDRSGRVWLHPPQGAGRPELIDEAVAERSVADHGFDRIDQAFPSWEALDSFRQGRAARVTPDVVVDRAALDMRDVERLWAVARRWVVEGQGPRARRLAYELLRVPAVRADEATHNGIVSFVEGLEEPRLATRSRPATELQSAARARWQSLDLAA